VERHIPAQNSRTAQLRVGLIRQVAARAAEGDHPTAVPGLSIYRRSQPTACTSAAYQPSLVVFLQGQKRINLGRTTYICDGSNFLLTSVDLPVVSQVIDATPEKPILGLLLRLEMAEIRRILSEHELPIPPEPSGARGMAVGVTSAELLGACSRLVNLLDTPQDIPFLAPLIQREIIYRLLRSPQGNHLRAIATLGEQSHRTARVISWLRANYARPLRVEDLAAMAQMGVSTLHHHFRSLTAMSPPAISEASAPARGARAYVGRRTRRCQRRFRGRIRERQPVQPRIQPLLRAAAHARHQIPSPGHLLRHSKLTSLRHFILMSRAKDLLFARGDTPGLPGPKDSNRVNRK